MIIDMFMPQMGESVAEATVTKWLKQVGDKVAKDEPLLEITTDKVDSEIPSPAAGVLKEIVAKEGDTVEVKTVIARIESNSEGGVEEQAPSPAPSAPDPAPASAPAPAPAAAPSPGAQVSGVSPLVKNLAAKHGLSDADLSQVSGTGPGGRITKHDLLEHLVKKGAGAPRLAEAPPPIKLEYGDDGRRVEPMNKMRSLIAEHMVRSKQTSPHVYTVAEVDMSRVAAWRKKHAAAFLSRHGFKLNFTPFILEAVAKALALHPIINASIEGSDIVYKRDINLGCAVALGTEGLVVPVIRNADQLSLTGLAEQLQDLAQRARSKSLSPDDTVNGTFTVTNAGTFGSILSYPIINQPQLGILGVGAIKKRPVVVDDLIGIREICFMTLSYDHRLIDGSLAGRFLQHIARHLEEWDENQSI